VTYTLTEPVRPIIMHSVQGTQTGRQQGDLIRD
jgi:hypothetical protein